MAKKRFSFLMALVLILTVVLLAISCGKADDPITECDKEGDPVNIDGDWSYYGKLNRNDGTYEIHSGTCSFTQNSDAATMSCDFIFTSSNSAVVRDGNLDMETTVSACGVAITDGYDKCNNNSCYCTYKGSGEGDTSRIDITLDVRSSDCSGGYGGTLDMQLTR